MYMSDRKKKKALFDDSLPDYLDLRPDEVEKESFLLITRELHKRKIRIPYNHAPIVLRCIHTSADYDFAENLLFSKNAVPMAHKALLSGACIVSDTRMGLDGMNRGAIKILGGEPVCLMDDPNVTAEARLRGMTRSAVSMEYAASRMLAARQRGDETPYIFVVGNAPTALMALDSMMRENEDFRPDLIIAAPAGFINVEYAKRSILKTMEEYQIPYILTAGCKGGSCIASSIVNALLGQMKNEITRHRERAAVN